LTGCSSSPEGEPDPLAAAIQEWRACFNEGRYFEAHEVLEGHWLRCRTSERDFLKGLIHLAVSLHHLEKRNAHGARVKLASGRRYLEPFGSLHRGLRVAHLLSAVALTVGERLAGREAPDPRAEWDG